MSCMTPSLLGFWESQRLSGSGTTLWHVTRTYSSGARGVTSVSEERDYRKTSEYIWHNTMSELQWRGWQLMSLVHLLESEHENMYLYLLIIAIKWTEAFPMQDQETTTVVKIFFEKDCKPFWGTTG